jgi:hypothetical protein
MVEPCTQSLTWIRAHGSTTSARNRSNGCKRRTTTGPDRPEKRSHPSRLAARPPGGTLAGPRPPSRTVCRSRLFASSCARARPVPGLSVEGASQGECGYRKQQQTETMLTCGIASRPLAVGEGERPVDLLVDDTACNQQGYDRWGGGGGGAWDQRSVSISTHVSAISKTSNALSHQGRLTGGSTEPGRNTESRGHSASVSASARVPISQLCGNRMSTSAIN